MVAEVDGMFLCYHLVYVWIKKRFVSARNYIGFDYSFRTRHLQWQQAFAGLHDCICFHAFVGSFSLWSTGRSLVNYLG